MKNSPFTRFVESVGGDDAAAVLLGISNHTVSAYRRGVRGVSLDIARDVERLSRGAISRVAVLYPDEAEKVA